MKNIVKNLISTIFITLLFVIGISEVNAVSAPSSIYMEDTGGANAGYHMVNNWTFGIKQTKDPNGNIIYAYCLEKENATPSGVYASNIGELGAGYISIIESKPNTGSAAIDYYIRQIAVWWYIDRLEGVADTADGHLSANLKSGNVTGADYRNKAKAIVDAAQKANISSYNASYSSSVASTTMTLTNDKKYYVSSLITHSGRYNNGSYTVSGVPIGTILLDANDNVISGNVVKGNFKIKVPVSSLSFGNNSIKVSISSSAYNRRAYRFDPANQNLQDVTPAYLYTVPTTLSSSVNLTANVSTSVYVSKVDSSDYSLIAGAELVIKDSNGNVVKTITSGTTKTYITDLKPGTYTLQETKAPEGYKLNNNINTFKVEVGTIANVSISDTQTEVKISKQDITNKKELVGAHLVLKDKDGKVIEEWNSTEEPHYIYRLITGETYILEETIAPIGYYLSTEKVSFTVKDDGTVNEVIMNNDPTKVVINKLDIKDKKPLSGASLVLKDSKGNVVEKWVSTDKPYVIYGLEIGEKYILEEKEAPENYSKAESIEFEVLSDKETIVDMYDSVLVKVPDTGMNKSLIWIISGIVLIGAGVGTIIYVRKRKEA